MKRYFTIDKSYSTETIEHFRGDAFSTSTNEPTSTSFCIVQDNTYKCIIPAKEDLDYYNQNGYVKCNSDNDCSQLLTEAENKNITLPYECISGECSNRTDIRSGMLRAPGCNVDYTPSGDYVTWKKGGPQLGITQMKYGKCGGGYTVGGSCDLKQFTTDKVNNQNFPCPPGTKPYFWASKNDTSIDFDCDNHHKGIYSRIDYTCCDDKAFQYDENNTQPSGYPNKSFCLQKTYSLKNKMGQTSVIIGRDGKIGNKNKDNPIASENSCNIHSGPSLTKLRRLLADANWEIWNQNSLDCSKAEGD